MSSKELKRYYRHAIAVLVPSVCYEVFGLTVVEAFSTGTPAIVRDLGALPELIEASGGGFVFRTDDELIEAMERLRSDPKLRGRMSESALAAQRKLWSEEGHVRAYEELVKELIEGK